MATDSTKPVVPTLVFKTKPVDVSMIRDPGMRAIVLFAVSLGWDALSRPNSPVYITARDGTQRRLPTNTSIRMSVFQAALSTIMVHTDDHQATPELIDEIVKETKLDRDHERRLRLAVGETADDHRQRLANEKVAEQKREPDEHLTQRPVVPVPEALVDPVDGKYHGKMTSRKPTIAHYATGKGSASTYESDSSLERVWEDGFIDYECPTCGKAFGTSRGCGSHRQVHIQSGEVEYGGTAYERAIARNALRGPEPDWTPKPRRTKAEMAVDAVIPAADDLVFGELPPSNPMDLPPLEGEPPEPFEEPATYPIGDERKLTEEMTEEIASLDVIDQIAALVAPQVNASRDMWKQMAERRKQIIDDLTAQLDEKTKELDGLRSDWDALRGLIDGR